MEFKMAQTLIEKYDLQGLIGVVNAPTAPSQEYSEKRRLLLTDILEEETLGIEKNMGDIEKKAREEAIAEVLQTVYPTIDMSFLSMRHPDTDSHALDSYSENDYFKREPKIKVILPRFAVYSLDSPECVVAMIIESQRYCDWSRRRWTGKIRCIEQSVERPKLPKELSDPLVTAISINENDSPLIRSDTGKRDDKYALSSNYLSSLDRHRYTYSSQFAGGIPRDVKNELKVAKKTFGKHLYVIAEVDSWKDKEIRDLPSTGDPLIVGVKAQRCFLISEFNCTTIEDYVCKEFKES